MAQKYIHTKSTDGWQMCKGNSIEKAQYFQQMVPEQFDAAAAAAKSLQLCPTLCDPVDGSPPGFPVPGIFQARVLKSTAFSIDELRFHNF